MAFIPKLNMCFENCNRIRFVDVTGLYDSPNNLEGYGSTNNVIGNSDIDSAIITVLDLDGNTEFTYDVSTQIPTTVVGHIIFTDYTTTVLADGSYTLKYTITMDDSTVYTYQSGFCNTCNFEACIDKAIATVPTKLCADPCATDYLDNILLMEGLLYGYKCAASCEKITLQAEIENRLDRICDFDCNCD